MNLTEFFGRDEWSAMFSASVALFIVSALFLFSRVALWIAFFIFLIAVLFTGYKLFIVKKDASLSAEVFEETFSKKKK
jgi:hypothetical protein